MASSNHQIDKPQCGHPKRAELPDVNINAGMQSINTENFFKRIETPKSSVLHTKQPCLQSTPLVYMKLIVHFGVYPTTKKQSQSV